MTRAATGRLVRAAGVVFVAVLVGLAWRSMVGSAGSPAPIAPGTEILSVQPDEVMSFVYIAGTLNVNAHRVQPAAPFSVHVTFADGRASRQCVAPPGLADRLAPLTTLIARGSVPFAELETAFPTPLGTLEMRDRIASEPLPTLAFRGGGRYGHGGSHRLPGRGRSCDRRRSGRACGARTARWRLRDARAALTPIYPRPTPLAWAVGPGVTRAQIACFAFNAAIRASS